MLKKLFTAVIILSLVIIVVSGCSNAPKKELFSSMLNKKLRKSNIYMVMEKGVWIGYPTAKIIKCQKYENFFVCKFNWGIEYNSLGKEGTDYGFVNLRNDKYNCFSRTPSFALFSKNDGKWILKKVCSQKRF